MAIINRINLMRNLGLLKDRSKIENKFVILVFNFFDIKLFVIDEFLIYKIFIKMK